MGTFSEGYLLNRQEYGCFYPYLTMDGVKRIFWNGRGLWIEDEEQGRYMVTDSPDEGFLERFGMIMSNRCGLPFNRTHPVMEWEGKYLYIQMIHASMAPSGMTVLLKKKDKAVRMSGSELVESGICREEALTLLRSIIQGGESCILSGPYGGVTTDLALFMTRYFSPEDRVICLQKGEEPDPASCNPDKDITSFRIDDDRAPESLDRLVRSLHPQWLMSIYPDEETVSEIIRLEGLFGISGIVVVSCGRDGSERAMELLYPGADRDRMRQDSEMLNRSFPVRITCGRDRLEQIVRYRHMKKEILYEREPEE